MRRIEAALRTAVADLNDLGRSFALIGGFAVSARSEPRTTKDVDFAVLVADDEDAEQLAFQLAARGYTVKTTVEQRHTKRLATIRTEAPSGTVVDLLFASSGIEPEIVGAATPINILGDLVIPVATIAHLIATKVLARDDRQRPQDRVDLKALLDVASAEALADARAALRLVTTRECARGRDLEADLEQALTELGPESRG
ncbi:MAG: hypothetical protein DRI90_17555 [Deltaproteobacteria bacterium]|nr:MAG: hypothetical protein DRI90_17555 [Deltaproteobacteria bacterium]